MDRMILDRDVLTAYIGGFLGFGNPAADIWFVGMEEGGGRCFTDVNERLKAWDARGRKALEDIFEYHRAHDQYAWFRTPQSAVQPTWLGLMRIALARSEEPTDIEAVRAYQYNSFARANGAECLMELSSLPSPGVADWHYDEFSDLEELVSRERYVAAWFPRRRALIRAQIQAYHPAVVVFYGLGYKAEWEAITGTELALTQMPGVLETVVNGTRYCCVRHPARERNADYFVGVGERLRDR